MSLTMLKNGLDVFLAEDRAVGRFHYESTSDLPVKGASVDWVDSSSNWYADETALSKGVHDRCQITARRPGRNWTWASLAPIETLGFYELQRNISLSALLRLIVSEYAKRNKPV